MKLSSKKPISNVALANDLVMMAHPDSKVVLFGVVVGYVSDYWLKIDWGTVLNGLGNEVNADDVDIVDTCDVKVVGHANSGKLDVEYLNDYILEYVNDTFDWDDSDGGWYKTNYAYWDTGDFSDIQKAILGSDWKQKENILERVTK